MVEAAIVLLMIVVTWGAMATAYTAGSAKLGAQWDARVSVMYYASHECKHAMPRRTTDREPPNERVGEPEQGGRFNTASGDAEGDRATNGAPLGDSAEARSSFFIASASATKTRTLAERSATKTSSSWCVCNEGKYSGDLLGFLAYGADFFRDLLPGPIQAIF